MKKIILHPSGKEVACEDNQTVLDALEKNGLALPNNCRAGACGECKIKVRSGQIDQGLVLDMALSPSEREEGYGLMCMAKLKGESLEIEYGTEDALPKLFPPETDRPYIVTDKQLVTPSIARLTLRALGKSMRFWPGQYIGLGDVEQNKPQRCYSIANIPNEWGDIVIYVTKIEGGVTSSWLHEEVAVGNHLNLSGPYGTFIGDPSAETPVLCLAAGSGLAPIYSLTLAALLRGGFRYPVDILFSARSNEHLFDLGPFRYLEAKFRNFNFRHTFTRSKNPDGLVGRVPDILSELYPDLSGHSVYIAGSPKFVDDCKAKINELGAKEEFVHTEGFFSQTTKTP